jgi:hypothetical protein
VGAVMRKEWFTADELRAARIAELRVRILVEKFGRMSSVNSRVCNGQAEFKVTWLTRDEKLLVARYFAESTEIAARIIKLGIWRPVEVVA